MNSNPIEVFISYAWESDEFREKVGQLAGWLEREGAGRIKVVTDHLYTNRPPKEGWATWMENQIQESEIVLVVCSPLYHARFNKREPDPNKGRGSIFEGTIITQEIYNAQSMNEKFFPISPDDGDVKDVPIILQPFYNGHKFHTGNVGILKCILNENPKYEDFIKDFFDAPSVNASIKESIAESFQKEILNEIEKEILNQIINPQLRKENIMLSPLQITVRAFLTLNDIDKMIVIEDLGLNKAQFRIPNTVERDKQLFKEVSDKKLLDKLWQSLNKIKPFEINENPFLTIAT